MSVVKNPIYRKIYKISRYVFPMCLSRSNMSYCSIDYNLYGKVYNSKHYKLVICTMRSKTEQRITFNIANKREHYSEY